MRPSGSSGASPRALADEAAPPRKSDPLRFAGTVSARAPSLAGVSRPQRSLSPSPALVPLPPAPEPLRESAAPASGTMIARTEPEPMTSIAEALLPEALLPEALLPPTAPAEPAPLPPLPALLPPATLPPLDTSVEPPGPPESRGPDDTAARRPLLASEALMEDLAPVEPARGAALAWCAGMGSAFLIFGSLPLLGLLPGGLEAAVPWLVTGVISLVASITRVTYRQRAVAMVVLGLLSGVVALQGAGGALMRAGGGAAWGLARLFAAVALPAALLFRSRYRAYAGARVFLGTALAISLPFGVHTAMSLVGSGTLTQVGAVAVLLVLAASLGGFMGSETTGAGAYIAPATVGVLAADLGLGGLRHGLLLGAGTGAVAFAGAAGLASLGIFQILAWRFAEDARRIDLHSRGRESQAPPSEPDPASDWSMRE
jgi:hypothetical protein